MKLQQLRYIVEVVNHNLNVSSTAEGLYTSQPGISKQIRMLEDELGVQIFARSGKHFTQVTPVGLEVVKIASEILSKTEAIKTIANEYTDPNRGVLRTATTHAQANYAYLKIIKGFTQKYPGVSLSIFQSLPQQIPSFVLKGDVEFAIAPEMSQVDDGLVFIPCDYWTRAVIVAKDHPLAVKKKLTIEDIAAYPIITYDSAITGGVSVEAVFQRAGQSAQIMFATTDSEAIKKYAKLGLGVGIIANIAVTETDHEFVKFEASHIFNPVITNIILKRGAFLRNYVYEFLHGMAPHIPQATFEALVLSPSNEDVKELMKDIKLPIV